MFVQLRKGSEMNDQRHAEVPKMLPAQIGEKPLKFWQFTTVVLVALTMGMTFIHVLQMHSKMAMSGPLWLTLQHNLYSAYRTIGGPLEIGAMLSVAMLAYAVR